VVELFLLCGWPLESTVDEIADHLLQKRVRSHSLQASMVSASWCFSVMALAVFAD
jgi:hypothetical protein